MQKFLIDTHILIWYTENDKTLSNKLLSLIENQENTIYVSVISFYEIAIKIKIGKLEMDKTFKELFEQLAQANINILPINEIALSEYLNIPLLTQHKDPFDRLIIATAIAHNFKLISADKNFELYNELVEIIF